MKKSPGIDSYKTHMRLLFKQCFSEETALLDTILMSGVNSISNLTVDDVARNTIVNKLSKRNSRLLESLLYTIVDQDPVDLGKFLFQFSNVDKIFLSKTGKSHIIALSEQYTVLMARFLDLKVKLLQLSKEVKLTDYEVLEILFLTGSDREQASPRELEKAPMNCKPLAEVIAILIVSILLLQKAELPLFIKENGQVVYYQFVSDEFFDGLYLLSKYFTEMDARKSTEAIKLVNSFEMCFMNSYLGKICFSKNYLTDITIKIFDSVSMFVSTGNYKRLDSKTIGTLQSRQTLLPSCGVKIEFESDVLDLFAVPGSSRPYNLLLNEIISDLDEIFVIFKVLWEDGTYCVVIYDVMANIVSVSDIIGIFCSKYGTLCATNYTNSLTILLEIYQKVLDYYEQTQNVPVVTEVTLQNVGKLTESRILYGEFIKINPYIRILPDGHCASVEAKVLADKLGLKLKSNETIVRSFTRKVNRASFNSSTKKPEVLELF